MRDGIRLLGAVLRNAALRRTALAFACFIAAEYAVWIAMLVYAYDRGGSAEAGVVAFLVILPALITAAGSGVLVEHFGASRVLAGSYVVQAGGALAAGALMLADGAAIGVYGVMALMTMAIVVSRPAQAVLIPALAHRAEELTAANVVTGWMRSSALFVSPALAGVGLALTSPGALFVIFGGVMLLAGVLSLTVAHHVPPPPRERRGLAGFLRQLRAGTAELRAATVDVARHREARIVLLLIATQVTVVGALDVLVVDLAHVLDLGAGGAGWLAAAVGAGAVFGAAASVVLVGRRHLAPALVLTAAVSGLALVVLGLVIALLMAFTMLFVTGMARAAFEVTSETLLQRTAPSHVLAHVFALLEAAMAVGLALGSIVVAPLVALGGAELALIVVGCFVPGVVLLCLRTLRSIDGAATVPVVQLSLLRRLRIFAPLPPPEIEGLARSARTEVFPAGAQMIRQGDVGDRYFAIATGTVEVRRDGTVLATLTRGDGVGEIALLRDVPRTADVFAVDDVETLVLDKEAFVVALTGCEPARQGADEIIRGMET